MRHIHPVDICFPSTIEIHMPVAHLFVTTYSNALLVHVTSLIPFRQLLYWFFLLQCFTVHVISIILLDAPIHTYTTIPLTHVITLVHICAPLFSLSLHLLHFTDRNTHTNTHGPDSNSLIPTRSFSLGSSPMLYSCSHKDAVKTHTNSSVPNLCAPNLSLWSAHSMGASCYWTHFEPVRLNLFIHLLDTSMSAPIRGTAIWKCILTQPIALSTRPICIQKGLDDWLHLDNSWIKVGTVSFLLAKWLMRMTLYLQMVLVVTMLDPRPEASFSH